MARQMKNVRGTGHTIAKAYDASISMVKREVATIAWSAAQATAGTTTAVHAAAACARRSSPKSWSTPKPFRSVPQLRAIQAKKALPALLARPSLW